MIIDKFLKTSIIQNNIVLSYSDALTTGGRETTILNDFLVFRDMRYVAKL
jgi:hypothetical protein